MSLKIPQDYMKVFFNFQSSRYEEIIEIDFPMDIVGTKKETLLHLR